jgi:hypothetical protein
VIAPKGVYEAQVGHRIGWWTNAPPEIIIPLIMAKERVQRQIDRLLDQAEETMPRLDWETVRECAKVVLGLDAANSDAQADATSLAPWINDKISHSTIPY